MILLSRLLVYCGFASGSHLAHEHLGRSGSNAKKDRHAASALTGSHSRTMVFGAITADGEEFLERCGAFNARSGTGASGRGRN